MRTAVDTSILFDLLLDDPTFADRSATALSLAVEQGPVLISAVTYAELAAHFNDAANLDAFLRDFGIALDQFEPATLRRAASAWAEYTRRRGVEIQCGSCGKMFKASCPECKRPVAWRQHLVPDFLIGAHAEIQADCLLTRDRGYYSKYFPDLKLLGD